MRHNLPVNDPADLRARIADALRLAAECVARGDDIGHDAALAAAEVFRMRLAGHEALTSNRDSTITTQVSASPIVISAKLSRGMGRSRVKKHPFIRALYESTDPKRPPQTVTDWAEAHDVPVATVASWVSKGKGGRKIPMRWAKVIETELGVPASVAIWRNGILSE
jgi:hypothetical protein